MSQVKITELARRSNLVKSNGEARRLILERGLYLNGELVTDPDLIVSKDQVRQGTSGRYIFLRKGKKNTVVIRTKAS